MKDEYGTEQIYLVQPTKVEYQISHGGDGVKTVNEGMFRTYYTCDARGFQGGINILLNRVGATRFAKQNGLEIITDIKQYEILGD